MAVFLNHVRSMKYALFGMIIAAGMMCLPLSVVAREDGFAPAVFVNGRVISQYELRQRVLFM